MNLSLHVLCPRPKEGFWPRHSPTERNARTTFCEATSSRPGKHRTSNEPRASPNAISCHSAQSLRCRDAESSRCGQRGGASCTLSIAFSDHCDPCSPWSQRERQERSSRARGRSQLDTTVAWRAKEPPFDAYPASDLSSNPCAVTAFPWSLSAEATRCLTTETRSFLLSCY